MSEQALPNANEQSMQPTGSLQEGDQAIVDAMQTVPEGLHITQEGGVLIHIEKSSGDGQQMVVVRRLGEESVVSAIDLTEDVSGTSVVTGTSVVMSQPSPNRTGQTTKSVIGDKVRVGKRNIQDPDGVKAQAIKSAAAARIAAAVQHID